MPTPSLLAQLDALRDAYTQRDKTALALLAALKATTNAHGKTLKALRDYGDQDTTVDVSGAQTAFGGLRLKEETIDPLAADLRRETKTLAGLTAALKEAGTALRSEPVDVVRLDKALATLQSSSEQKIQDILPDLREELDIAQRVLGDEFGQKLRETLAGQGVSLGGRAPKFEIGRFELEANFAKRFLILRYGKDIVAPHIPITAEAAVKAYQAAAKLVGGRNQDGAAWMNQFHEAYQIARRKRLTHGARVNIVDVYIELVLLRQGRAFASEPSKRTFSDYSRAQFAYDFYEFSHRRRLAYDGHVVKAHSATKSQTDSPTKSMWIVEGDSPYDGRYIADVEFVKE